MVSAWYYDEGSTAGPQEPHQYSPNRAVSIEELKKMGILYFNIDIKQPDYMDKVEALCKERDYKNRDEICVSRDKLPNYDEKLKMFFTEHLHEDEEIRFIKEGTGYFDVRSPNDEWVRICVEPSDLIIVPAGIYHRFVVDTNDYIVALRLFKDEPKWTPVNRGAESEVNSFRIEYLESIRV